MFCPEFPHAQNGRLLNKKHPQCIPNKDNPDDRDAPCLTCLSVSKTKKTIHNSLCFRLDVTTIVLYRSGGLKLTRRWEGTQLKDVGDWADDNIRVIQMAQGLCSTPVTLRVRRFNPNEGDVLVRRWVDNGVAETQDLPPYALADIHETATAFEAYLRNHALEGLTEAVRGSDELIERTYAMIFNHYYQLPVCSLPQL